MDSNLDDSVSGPLPAELLVAIGLALLLQDRESAGPEGKLAALHRVTDQTPNAIEVFAADELPWILLNDEPIEI